MKLFIFGDTHGEYDMGRLTKKRFPEGSSLTEEDSVVVLGDFGLLWSVPRSPTERYWLDWLEERPWTTLFVDGNHENFDLLNALPRAEKYGGTVGVAGKKIFHLRRGEIYDIAGFRCFAFGGARSYDTNGRKPGKSWWSEEIPSGEEFDRGMRNLERTGFDVRLVFSHTAPASVFEVLNKNGFPEDPDFDPTRVMLERFRLELKFSEWYFGHFHTDTGPFRLPGEPGFFRCLYDDVARKEKTATERIL